MPQWIQISGLQLCVCDRREAASLLGCSFDDIGKWVDAGFLANVALPVPYAPGWEMRYPLYEDVCWLIEAFQRYSTLSLEQILWYRHSGRLEK